MTQEQKDYLTQIIKFRAVNPFDSEESDLIRINELKEVIYEKIKNYKEIKKRIEERRNENKRVEELLKAINEVKQN
jgi:acyl-[acyl carrier protein]--UDP-N-acetylglucosamine O-acyltransferase